MANEIKSGRLKGVRALRVWPVTVNDATTYTTEEMIAVPALQSLTKEVTSQDFTIYADDAVYDTGSEYQYEDLTVKLAELPLELEAKLQGGDFDQEEGSYTFKSTSTAPEFALGYAAMMKTGNFRMFKHYAVKLMKVKIDHQTKGSGTEEQSFELTFRNAQRMADGAVRVTKDSADETYTWLNSIDNLPVTEPGA